VFSIRSSSVAPSVGPDRATLEIILKGRKKERNKERTRSCYTRLTTHKPLLLNPSNTKNNNRQVANCRSFDACKILKICQLNSKVNISVGLSGTFGLGEKPLKSLLISA
jgi:predicted neuraminidase